jgi:hypothetical protein
MTKEKTAAASKGGAAASPQDSADKGAISNKGTHVVTAGNRIGIGNRMLVEGDRLSASDLANSEDADGKKGLQRLIDGKEVEKYKATAKDDDAGDVPETSQTTGNGAGPSAAQIIAADNGNDPAAAAVVDAALTGTEADVVAANAGGPEAPKA